MGIVKTITTEPTITKSAFFALPEVKACREIQRRNRYGSQPHRLAHETIEALAAKYGAAQFIGEYRNP